MQPKYFNRLKNDFFSIYNEKNIPKNNVGYFCALKDFLITNKKTLGVDILEIKDLIVFLDVEQPYDYVIDYKVFDMDAEVKKIANRDFNNPDDILDFIKFRLYEMVTHFVDKDCPHGCSSLMLTKLKKTSGELLLLECPVCTLLENLDGSKYISDGDGELALVNKNEAKNIENENYGFNLLY